MILLAALACSDPGQLPFKEIEAGSSYGAAVLGCKDMNWVVARNGGNGSRSTILSGVWDGHPFQIEVVGYAYPNGIKVTHSSVALSSLNSGFAMVNMPSGSIVAPGGLQISNITVSESGEFFAALMSGGVIHLPDHALVGNQDNVHHEFLELAVVKDKLFGIDHDGVYAIALPTEGQTWHRIDELSRSGAWPAGLLLPFHDHVMLVTDNGGLELSGQKVPIASRWNGNQTMILSAALSQDALWVAGSDGPSAIVTRGEDVLFRSTPFGASWDWDGLPSESPRAGEIVRSLCIGDSKAMLLVIDRAKTHYRILETYLGSAHKTETIVR